LRGGGAGSWGVVINATLRLFPTFDIAQHLAIIVANSSAAIGQLATLHAQHIFDWDAPHAGQYFFVVATPAPSFTWLMASFFPNSSLATANASMAPFLDAATAQGFNISTVASALTNANDALSPNSSDTGGADIILGSRLVPADVYRHNVTAIGEAYQKLFDEGAPACVITSR
jgi:hypothetical protein